MLTTILLGFVSWPLKMYYLFFIVYVYKDGFADRMNTIYPAVYPDSIFLRKGFSFFFFFV